jgi:hypothetical protein
MKMGELTRLAKMTKFEAMTSESARTLLKASPSLKVAISKAVKYLEREYSRDMTHICEKGNPFEFDRKVQEMNWKYGARHNDVIVALNLVANNGFNDYAKRKRVS